MEVGCRFSPPSHNAGGVSSSVRAQAVLLDVWKRRGNSGVRWHSLPHCRRLNGLVIHAVAHPRRLARHQRPNAATLSPAETASDKAQSPETGNGSKPAEEVIQESAGPRVPVEKVVLIQGALDGPSLMSFANAVVHAVRATIRFTMLTFSADYLSGLSGLTRQLWGPFIRLKTVGL